MDPMTEGQEISKTRAMKVDRWARLVVPIMFVIQCTTLITLGLSHDEPINEKPGHEVHYLKSVKREL